MLSAKCIFWTFLCIKTDRLFTILYRKSTDRNSILHEQSFHPISLKRGLPISQFSHIRRICSSEADFKAQAADLEKRFLTRQYKHQWAAEAHSRFKNVSQTECLEHTRPKTLESRVNCIIQYSPLSKQFQPLIKKHRHIIQADPASPQCLGLCINNHLILEICY